jgi:hypothetical protein
MSRVLSTSIAQAAGWQPGTDIINPPIGPDGAEGFAATHQGLDSVAGMGRKRRGGGGMGDRFLLLETAGAGRDQMRVPPETE